MTATLTRKLFAGCLLAATAAAAEQAPNLLAKAQLRRDDNVENPARITDGVAPVEGDMWKSDFTSVIGPKGVVEWDLGEPTAVEAGMLQADNNDTYILTGSLDGTTWVPLWRAGSTEGAGMRQRSSDAIRATVRYVRLTAEGGDNLFSVGEVVLLSHVADLNHYEIKRVDRPHDPPPPVNTSWVLIAVVAIALVLFLRKRNEAPVPAPAAPPGDEPPAKS